MLLTYSKKHKKYIESAYEYKEGVCSVRVKDLETTFWFSSAIEVQNFINKLELERFATKELRKGYIDYVNESNECVRIFVENNRGRLTIESMEVRSK